jgi:hypothetical protein
MATRHSSISFSFAQGASVLAARLADSCVDRAFMPSTWGTYFHRFLQVLIAAEPRAVQQTS